MDIDSKQARGERCNSRPRINRFYRWRWSLWAIAALLILLVIFAIATPPARANFQTDSRISRLESQVASLQSRLSRLEAGSRQSLPGPSSNPPPRSTLPPPISTDERAMLDRLAILVIEIKDDLQNLDRRLSALETRLPG